MRFGKYSVLSLFAVAFAVWASAAQAATTATWSGTSSVSWSDSANWNSGAGPAPLSGDTATFNNIGVGHAAIDTTGGVAINSILFDNAGAPAYTLGGETITLDSGGNITMNASVVNNQMINAAVNLGGPLTLTNNSSSGTLMIAGNMTNTNTTLTVSGSGDVTLKGNISLNTSQTTDGGAITIQGGGTLELAGGLTDNVKPLGKYGYGVMNVGTATSGNNTLKVNGATVSMGSLVIGQGTSSNGSLYGQNAVLISTPGNALSPTYQVGRNASDYRVGVYSSSNSLTISNGAYVGTNTNGGINRIFVGEFAGANNNTLTITGSNSQLNSITNAMYVGSGFANGLVTSCSGNTALVNNGGSLGVRFLVVGGSFTESTGTPGPGSNNSVVVSGLGSSLNINVSPSSTQFVVGASAGSSGNSISVQSGATATVNGNGGTSPYTKLCGIGLANGADNNAITINGSGSSLVFTFANPLTIGGQVTGGDYGGPTVVTDSNASGNHLDVLSGGSATINTAIYLMGVNSAFNLGDGGSHVSVATVGTLSPLTPFSPDGVYLKNSDSRLNINNGRLVANQLGPLVSGPGQITLNGPAYFYTDQAPIPPLPVNSLDSAITGSGSLTKEGSATLTISQTNTYSGDTKIAKGVLNLSSSLAMQNSSLDTSGAGIMTLSSSVTTPIFGGLKGSIPLAAVIHSSLTVSVRDKQG